MFVGTSIRIIRNGLNENSRFQIGRRSTTFRCNSLSVSDFGMEKGAQTGALMGKVSGPVSYGLLSQTIDRIILGETIGDITTGEVENR